MVIATNTSVEVMWAAPSDPNGVIFAYSLTLQDSSNMVVSSQNVSNDVMTGEFDNLVPFSDYTVTVRALTGDNGEIMGEPAMNTFMTEIGGKYYSCNSKTGRKTINIGTCIVFMS